MTDEAADAIVTVLAGEVAAQVGQGPGSHGAVGIDPGARRNRSDLAERLRRTHRWS